MQLAAIPSSWRGCRPCSTHREALMEVDKGNGKAPYLDPASVLPLTMDAVDV